MRILFAFLFIFLTHSSNAQEENYEMYLFWVNKADSIYNSANYTEAANFYAKGFSFLNRKAYPHHRYTAACAYSLSGEKDSAFYHLNRLLDKSAAYLNESALLNDTALSALKSDPRWDQLKSQFLAYKNEVEKDMDWELKKQLDSIYEIDQKLRQQYPEMSAKYESDSKEMKAFWDQIRKDDSLNVIEVSKILDSHGWLGKEVVGRQGNSCLFLVIQHAKIDIQEKYLPMMRQAVANGKAKASSLALLEDRILLRRGKKQIYGSQIGTHPESKENYVLPLQDPINVDERRATVGLPPLQQYIDNWGLVWDVEQYIKMLPDYEALQQK